MDLRHDAAVRDVRAEWRVVAGDGQLVALLRFRGDRSPARVPSRTCARRRGSGGDGREARRRRSPRSSRCTGPCSTCRGRWAPTSEATTPRSRKSDETPTACVSSPPELPRRSSTKPATPWRCRARSSRASTWAAPKVKALSRTTPQRRPAKAISRERQRRNRQDRGMPHVERGSIRPFRTAD